MPLQQGFFLAIERFLERLGISKNGTFLSRHAIHFLNISQFLGVVNDNAFKFLIVFLFIDLKGAAKSSEILFWVGTVYVLPFLLFSSAAGVLADRFSKQKMVIFLKFMEVVTMILGVFAFLFKSALASYAILFLLSCHSAAFGPPKYSIIPELVSTRKIPKANGLITSFTYLGIIVGTFLASALTQITDRNFPLTAGACVFLAIIGFLSSIFIPMTEPKGVEKRINPLFVVEIYQNLVYAKRIPHLLVAIFGTSSFLFIGAYFQLNIVPFAIESLKISEIGGGYLFLITAIGIAAGAYLAGRLCKHRVEVGLACLGGIVLSLLLFVIGVLPAHLSLTIVLLIFLGVAGGLYIVPFDSFIQTYSPGHKRGQIIAATNFLSFCGVLLAPMLLGLFHSILGLQAAQGFIITSFLILAFILIITFFLKGFFFDYLSRLLKLQKE
jgi:acyl-[acyl-carrier-protein]-phospholipid O-acyltransferase/long-chain-fatty-acid--[acyl-carrier-protein] ligase